MYKITSCQISKGNENDKVVPYIDYNYSFCPVLSPFSVMFMGRGMFPAEEGKKNLRVKGISDHKKIIL